jgi:transposase-like protein
MAKSYKPMPPVPEPLKERYRVVAEVLSGAITVSEGARRLGLSRNRFQSVMHRGLEALIESLHGEPGRPAMPESERRLREEVRRLERENERLRKRAATTERVLGLARGLLRGRMERGTRNPKRRADAEDE